MVCGSCTSRVERRNVCVNFDADDEEEDGGGQGVGEGEEDRTDDDITYEIN